MTSIRLTGFTSGRIIMKNTIWTRSSLRCKGIRDLDYTRAELCPLWAVLGRRFFCCVVWFVSFDSVSTTGRLWEWASLSKVGLSRKCIKIPHHYMYTESLALWMRAVFRPVVFCLLSVRPLLVSLSQQKYHSSTHYLNGRRREGAHVIMAAPKLTVTTFGGYINPRGAATSAWPPRFKQAFQLLEVGSKWKNKYVHACCMYKRHGHEKVYDRLLCLCGGMFHF